jgi:hypothetical protein
MVEDEKEPFGRSRGRWKDTGCKDERTGLRTQWRDAPNPGSFDEYLDQMCDCQLISEDSAGHPLLYQPASIFM